MKLFKKSERTIRTDVYLANMRKIGFKTKLVGEYKKWKELRDGGRVSLTMNVYKLENEDMICYLISDTFGMNASPLTEEIVDINDWIKAHGYKPVKDFYLDDGMDEETWAEWNR